MFCNGSKPCLVDLVINPTQPWQNTVMSRGHARIVRDAANTHEITDSSQTGIFNNNIKIEIHLNVCEWQ